jgi:hypothetical protein
MGVAHGEQEVRRRTVVLAVDEVSDAPDGQTERKADGDCVEASS